MIGWWTEIQISGSPGNRTISRTRFRFRDEGEAENVVRQPIFTYRHEVESVGRRGRVGFETNAIDRGRHYT